MKNIIIIIAMLSATLLPALGADGIKIYNPDGTFQSYPISEIESISFEEMSYSTVFELYSGGELAFKRYTHNINYISFISGDTNLIDITYHSKYININENLYFEAALVDSILIYNTNNHSGRIYSEMNLEVSELARYLISVNKTNDGNGSITRDTTYYHDTLKIECNIKINFQRRYVKGFYNESCFYCGAVERSGELFLCADTSEFYSNQFDYEKEECTMQVAHLYLDSIDNKIDSLYFSYRYRQRGYQGPSENPKNSEKGMLFKLKDLDYEISDDGIITAIVNYNSSDAFYYGYSSSYFSGGGGGASLSGETTLINFDPPTEPITIKIVIK